MIRHSSISVPGFIYFNYKLPLTSSKQSIESLSLTRAIVIRTELESLITDAFVGSQGVHACSVIANVRIALTLVYVHAIVPVPGQRETRMANALETALQVVACTAAAYSSSLVALVDVHAVSLTQSKFVPRWTSALEVALLVYALSIATARVWNL